MLPVGDKDGLTWSRHLGVLQRRRGLSELQGRRDFQGSTEVLARSALALLDTVCLLGWAYFVAAPLTGDYLEWVYFKTLFNCIEIQLIIWNTHFHNIFHNYPWTLCLLSWFLFLYFRSSNTATSINLLKIIFKKLNWSQEESLSNLLKFLELIKKPCRYTVIQDEVLFSYEPDMRLGTLTT